MAKNQPEKKNPKKPKHQRVRGPSRRDLRSRFTRRDRDEVLLEISARFESEDRGVDDALGEFFECSGHLPPSVSAEAGAALLETIEVAYLWWGLFDLPHTDDGLPLVELELQREDLPAGHRAFLEASKSARMRLYDVVAVVPGRSVTLRDVFSDAPPVEARARTASRWLKRGELIATRIVRGPSGRRELDGGTFRYTEEQRPLVLDAVEDRLAYFDEFEPDADDDTRWAAMPPLLHHLFRDHAALERFDHDIEAHMSTHIIFRVLDAGAVSKRLETDERTVEIIDEPTNWLWIDPELGVEIPLGSLHLQTEDARLILHTCCFEHANEGRKMVEDLLHGLVECDHYEITIPRAAFEADGEAPLH